jgi:two-component system response regulator
MRWGILSFPFLYLNRKVMAKPWGARDHRYLSHSKKNNCQAKGVILKIDFKDPGMVEILLIEDDLDDAHLAMRALKKINIVDGIHHCSDGAEAIDFIYKNKAYHDLKLILMDNKMPKVDGLEVLKRIKRDELMRHIPVVVLTGSSDGDYILESARLGANAYLVKSAELPEFEEQLSKVVLYWMDVNNSKKPSAVSGK